MMVPEFRIVTTPRHAHGKWEIRAPDEPQRLWGPANFYACVRKRNQLVDALIHGESIVDALRRP